MIIFKMNVMKLHETFLLVQEHLKKVKTPQPIQFILTTRPKKKVGYNNYKTGT